MYYRARWYDVGAQRWLTRDPAGFTPGDANLYRYVGNSPTNATDPTGLAEWWQYVNSWDDFLGDVNHGWFAQASNASAGMADAITGGATAKLRAALGYDDAVDKGSDFYRYGGYAGQAVNIGLMVGNPTGWAGLALQGIKLATTASGLIDTARSTLAGDFSGASSMLLNTALSQLRGAGSPCSAVSRLASLAQRGMHLYGIYKGAEQAVDRFSQGDIIGGMLGLAETGVNAYQFLQACFAAGTRIQTRRGWVPIEEVVVADEVWSKPEAAPNHPGGWKPVEELFQRTGRILELRVGGQLIRTTPEHPFWVVGEGWVEAGSLKEGELLCSRDGSPVLVEEVNDTGDYQAVYNCRVGEWHTYFVGCQEWGFSLWAHNADCSHALTVSDNNARRDLRRALVKQMNRVNGTSLPTDKTPAGVRPHHLIGWEHKDNPVVQAAARGGFNINGVENGIFLDSRVVHPQGARHPNYNARVGRELNELQRLNLNDTQAAAALNRLANQLGGELRLRTIRLD